MAIAEKDLNSIPEQDSRRFLITKKQYYKMGAVGIFDDKPVELIEGEIVPLSPIGSLHWVAVNFLTDILVKSAPSGFAISSQSSLNANSRSDPVPDIAVVRGTIRDYSKALPTTAALVIEVADTTLRRDRQKADLYARAGIGEYWIVDLKSETLEVYRKPSGEREIAGSGAYAEMTTFGRGETVFPLDLPMITIAVDDLLP